MKLREVALCRAKRLPGITTHGRTDENAAEWILGRCYFPAEKNPHDENDAFPALPSAVVICVRKISDNGPPWTAAPIVNFLPGEIGDAFLAASKANIPPLSFLH